MKNTYLFVLAIAVALYCAPAFAQHGHAPADPGGMGSANGMSGASHANSNANTNGGYSNGGSAAASNGKTMDQLLTQNTRLSDKISSLTGESAQQSCAGFKNLGQCVAAAHVSKNLGINFDCLRSDMTGTAPATTSSCPAGTGSKSMSLGKSIQTLSPTVNSKTESKKGQQQANQDLKNATSNS
jgi:hypothetical protein